VLWFLLNFRIIQFTICTIFFSFTTGGLADVITPLRMALLLSRCHSISTLTRSMGHPRKKIWLVRKHFTQTLPIGFIVVFKKSASDEDIEKARAGIVDTGNIHTTLVFDNP
jgi:hypothetical protein